MERLPKGKGATSLAPTNGRTQHGEEQEDSKPIDFDTFVPSHDPSLNTSLPSHEPLVPESDYMPPAATVDQDEAFTRALEATYWGGYWTAVYHVSVDCLLIDILLMADP